MVAASPPLMINAAQATTVQDQGLLLAACGGLGICLYGVASRDRPLTVIGGLVVVVAGIAPLLQSGELAAFGFVGGPPAHLPGGWCG